MLFYRCRIRVLVLRNEHMNPRITPETPSDPPRAKTFAEIAAEDNGDDIRGLDKRLRDARRRARKEGSESRDPIALQTEGEEEETPITAQDQAEDSAFARIAAEDEELYVGGEDEERDSNALGEEGPKRGSGEILNGALAAGPFEGVEVSLLKEAFRNDEPTLRNAANQARMVRNALLVSAYEFARFGDAESRERLVYAEFQYAALLSRMEGWMTPKKNPLQPDAPIEDPRAEDRKAFLLAFEGRDRALMREMEAALLREGSLQKTLSALKEEMPKQKRDIIGHLANLPFVRALRGTFLVFLLASLAADSLPTEDRRKTEDEAKPPPRPDDAYGEPGAPIDPGEAAPQSATIEVLIPSGGSALQTVGHLIAETPNSPWLASWIDAEYAKAREQGFDVSTRERRVEFLTQTLGLYRPGGPGALSAALPADGSLRIARDRIELVYPGGGIDILASDRPEEVTGFRGDFITTK